MSQPSPDTRTIPIEERAPTPLPTEFSVVAKFDFDMLPSAFRRWIRDISERMQCPPDFPAVAAMVAVASIVGRQVAIRPKRNDDWQVVPNLYGGVVGPPGVLKTPSLKEPLAIISGFQSEAFSNYEQDKAAFEAAELVYQEQIKIERGNVKQSLKKSHRNDARSTAENLMQARPIPPVCRRFIVNDTTVERLQEILSENPNGVLLFRDELTGLLKQMDKPGHETDRAFLLEAWNGDGSFTSDRIGRGMTHVEFACLSILGGIQPGPLKSYFAGLAHGGGKDDGLLQRFQLLVYPDVSLVWLNVDRAPDLEARDAAHAVFKDLMDLKDSRGIEPQSDWQIPYLRFEDQAQEYFDKWRTDLEARLREGDLPTAIESHLAKFRSLVPSIALLIHLADGHAGDVRIESLKAALVWAEYLESHARRIYAPVLDPDMESARALLDKLKQGRLPPEFTVKEVYAPHWSNLTTSSRAHAAINVLTDFGWLSSEVQDTSGAPKTIYRLTVPKEAI